MIKAERNEPVAKITHRGAEAHHPWMAGIKPNLGWTSSIIWFSCGGSELMEGLLESVKAGLFLLLAFLDLPPAASSVPSVPALQAFLFPPLRLGQPDLDLAVTEPTVLSVGHSPVARLEREARY